jgi:hypothetical protein
MVRPASAMATAAVPLLVDTDFTGFFDVIFDELLQFYRFY